jgi:hypothetical protein
MGIYIDTENNLAKRASLYDLVTKGKKGQSCAFYAGYGFQHLMFSCVKMGTKTVNIYGFYRGWYSKREHTEPIVKVTKDCFTIHAGRFSTRHTEHTIGNWSHVLRGFLSMGIIDNISLRYLRNGTLISCNKVEVGTYYPMKIDWDGNLVGRVSKKAKDFANECRQSNKDIINLNARANYANTRVVRLVKDADISGNWDKVKPIDIFSLNNVARRTQLIEHFGMGTILKETTNTIVDSKSIDGRKYELIRFSFPRAGESPEPTTYLKMINPSTGDICIEGVPNNKDHQWNTNDVNMNTVEQALCWRDDDPSNEYLVPTILT